MAAVTLTISLDGGDFSPGRSTHLSCQCLIVQAPLPGLWQFTVADGRQALVTPDVMGFDSQVDPQGRVRTSRAGPRMRTFHLIRKGETIPVTIEEVVVTLETLMTGGDTKGAAGSRNIELT